MYTYIVRRWPPVNENCVNCVNVEPPSWRPKQEMEH